MFIYTANLRYIEHIFYIFKDSSYKQIIIIILKNKFIWLKISPLFCLKGLEFVNVLGKGAGNSPPEPIPI